MKHFFFTDKMVVSGKNNDRTLRIYRIKNGVPDCIAVTYYRPGSTKGAKSEVFNALMEHGYISKKWYNSSASEWQGPGYFSGEVINHYSIEEIY